MMTVQLYHNPQSRAVIIQVLLEEIGVPYELKAVNYEDGSMRSDEFLALNPMGKIPVLVDGDVVISETAAIALYLADKYKKPNDLAPGIDDPRRGEYLRWSVFQSTCIDGAMMQAGNQLELNRRQAQWGSPELVLDMLKQRLVHADPFLFGDWLTAADVLVATTLGWAFQFKLLPEDPVLSAYVGRVMSRPAAQRVFGANAQADA